MHEYYILATLQSSSFRVRDARIITLDHALTKDDLLKLQESLAKEYNYQYDTNQILFECITELSTS